MTKEKVRSSAGQRVVNIIGILLCIIFIPLIVINLVLIVKSYTTEEEIPTVFGVAPVICLSGSMEPEFSVGDLIFIQEVDPSTLEVGDVICFIPYGAATAVTHRIIETQLNAGQNVFITRGDANNTEDRMPVSAIEIQGKYTGLHIPGLGDIAMFMQTTLGMILFIVIPLLVFILWDVVRRAVSSRKKAGSHAAMEEELEMLRARVANGQEETQGGTEGQLNERVNAAQERITQEHIGDLQQDTVASDNHTHTEDADWSGHQGDE